MTITGRVLGFQKKEFEKDGSVIQYAQLLLRHVDGTVVRYSANKDFDFSPYVDKDVTLDVLLSTSQDLKPQLKVVGVLKK